jgi:hypothetical protein
MKLLIFLSVCVSLSVCQSPPKFCKGLDCPKYTVISSGPKFEIRTYAPAVWATVNVTGVDYAVAQNEAFDVLFKYISGANVNKQKIEMTAPVRDQVFPGAGPFCASSFLISFFVPFSLQANPVPPTDPRVVIETTPETTYAVYTFGGFAKNYTSTIVPNAVKLVDAVQAKGINVTTTPIIVSQYDSPFTIINRHNEIWLQVVKQQ